jgi:hypothetical protein
MIGARKSVSHGGLLGDIIYAIPALRAAGVERLYLTNVCCYHYYGPQEGGRLLEEMCAFLREQGIDCHRWQGEAVDADMDAFRDLPNMPSQSLVLRQAQHLGVADKISPDGPWLQSRPSRLADVVVHFKVGKCVLPDNWELLREVDAIAVGLARDYQALLSTYDLDIPWTGELTIAQLARVISGCKLYFGSNSMPLALANGLGKPRIFQRDALLESWLPGRYLELNRPLLRCLLWDPDRKQDAGEDAG